MQLIPTVIYIYSISNVINEVAGLKDYTKTAYTKRNNLSKCKEKMFSRVISISYCYGIKEVISFLLVATVRTLCPVEQCNAPWAFWTKTLLLESSRIV